MAKPTVDELMGAESGLNRSLAACVAAVLLMVGWVFIVSRSRDEDAGMGTTGLALFIVQVGCYIWYATAAGRAAKVLGETGWHYVVWILAAPFITLLPIEGILAMLIGASPLSIKFLLGRQLDQAIQRRPFED